MFAGSLHAPVWQCVSLRSLAHMHAGHDAIATPSGGAASLASSSMDDLVPTPSPQGSSQYASSAGSSSCGSSCGRSKANIDRVTTDQHMLSRTQRLQRLSSSLTYDDLPVPPSSEPATPTGDTVNNSLLAPDTPTCFKTPAISGSSGSVDPAVHDTSMDVSCASPDSESTIGRLQAVTGYTFAADAHGEEGSPVLPPLPDLPEQATARAADAQRAINSRRYVHIGCAVACLCVFALWARDASAASFSTRIFPT